MSQTLNTASSDRGLILGGNIISGDITIGSGSTTGAFNLNSGSFNFQPKGYVTQTGTQNSGVTVNAPIGQITTVSLSVANHNSERFTVTNNIVTTSSIIFACVNKYTGTPTLAVSVDNITNGTFDILLENTGGGVLNALAIVAFLVV